MEACLNYSPHLKEAMARIKAIVQECDIAAHVVLHEPGFSEYLMEIEPSWSVLRIEKYGIGIRSRLQEDFGGDATAQLHANESSVNLVRHFADLLARDVTLFERLYDIILEHWDVQHTDSKFTPHKPQ